MIFVPTLVGIIPASLSPTAKGKSNTLVTSLTAAFELVSWPASSEEVARIQSSCQATKEELDSWVATASTARAILASG